MQTKTQLMMCPMTIPRTMSYTSVPYLAKDPKHFQAFIYSFVANLKISKSWNFPISGPQPNISGTALCTLQKFCLLCFLDPGFLRIS